MFSIGFLLFIGLAVLMAINGLRSFFGSAARSKNTASAAIATGIVSFLAAGALVYFAFYMFRF